MLEQVIARHDLRRGGAPPGRSKGVVLLIHGRGATAESILPLGEVLAFPDLTYLAPQAEGYTWYPQSFMAPTAANEPFLSQSLRRITGIIADILASGTIPERLAVIGFSPGGLPCRRDGAAQSAALWVHRHSERRRHRSAWNPARLCGVALRCPRVSGLFGP